MSKKILIGCIFLAVSFYAAPGFSADYTNTSTSELTRLRGNIGNATSEDQAAFRIEWQKRVAGVETGEMKRNKKRNRTATGFGEGNNYQLSGTNGQGDCTTGNSRIRTSTSSQTRSNDRSQDRNTMSQSSQDRVSQGGNRQ